MDTTSKGHIIDAFKTLQYCLTVRYRRALRFAFPTNPFWLGRQFQTWKSEESSALVIVKGSYTSRFEVQSFCVNIIDLLRKSSIPVAWALKTSEDITKGALSVVDLLKSLTSQVLRLNIALRHERSLALSCARFRCAEKEDNWLDLLVSVLAGIPQIFLIVDVEAVSPQYMSAQNDFSWPSAFLNDFHKASERGLRTVIKVVVVSYGSDVFQGLPRKDLRNLVIPVARAQSTPLTARSRGCAKQRALALRRNGNSRWSKQSLAFLARTKWLQQASLAPQSPAKVVH